MKNSASVLKIIIATAAVVAACAAGGVTGCSRSGNTATPAAHVLVKPKYHCPMHPSVVSDRPGSCPICGMDLVFIEKTLGETSDAPAVPGLAVVSISTEARQRMGLTLGKVEKRAMTRNIRTSARIVADETRLFRVTTKVEGWVDRLFVSTTGQSVHKDDPLLAIYSPQLVSAQQEYLSTLRPADATGEATEAERTLMNSARRHLQLWDVSDEQIARLEKTRQVEKTMTLYAPASGFVMEKNVLAGQKLTSGDPLMVITDLSVVWGEADIYESDLPYVQVGMPISLTLSYWPGKVFSGKVSFISPSLDRETRTLKIRMEIPNSDSLLKLEMYADARLSYSLGEKVAAPESAIMRTGERNYAFRDSDGGRLVPVAVTTGALCDGYYEINSGLNAGDSVVTSANFLVDSESSMRAALEALTDK